MSDNTLSLIAFIVFAISFIPFAKWYIRRSKFVSAIDGVPGPPAYPLIGTAYLLFGVARRDIFHVNRRIHAQFPVILRMWLGPMSSVQLKRAEHIEKVLSSSRQHLQKSWGYRFVKQWLGDGLLIANGEKWHRHRKIITPTFHFSILEGFCEIFAEKSTVLVDKLRKHCDGSGPVDVYPFITKAALDIISEAAMGTQINAQDQIENEYVNAVYSAANLIVRRLLRPWLHMEFIYKWSSDGKKFAKALDVLHGYSTNVIRKRREARKTKTLNKPDDEDNVGRKRRLAFLDLLLETSGRDSSLSDLDIREEVDTFMFEGHDTTTSGITWTLFLLGLHPAIQESVYEEMKAIFGNSDRPATVHDLNEMNYLDRVIKETLRLYPPVPSFGRTLSEDLQVDEYKLPKGCMVIIEAFHLHRDERYFPDPERFDPDRFLPENTVDRHPYAYVPFSAGNRNCIGQKFAVYEEKSILSTIIRNFKWTTVGKREDIDLVVELILRPLDGVKLNLQKR